MLSLLFFCVCRLCVLFTDGLSLLCCRNVFPSFLVYGCKYHWKSAVRESLKTDGLVAFETENVQFADVVKWIMVLVYVRPTEVREYFAAIVNFVTQKVGEEKDPKWVAYTKPLSNFLGYMLKTWVGGGSYNPKFARDQWSCSRSLIDPTIPTTSNGTEAYNYHITRAIGASANRFWRTVQAIQDEESYSRYTTTTHHTPLLCPSCYMPPLSKKLMDIAKGERLPSSFTHKRRLNRRLKTQGRLQKIVEKSAGVAEYGDYKDQRKVLQKLVGVVTGRDC